MISKSTELKEFHENLINKFGGVAKMSLLVGQDFSLQNKEYICNFCAKEKKINIRKCSVCKQSGHTKSKCKFLQEEKTI